jgi:uncharacterized protein (DUF697 family)/predicted GTPase
MEHADRSTQAVRWSPREIRQELWNAIASPRRSKATAEVKAALAGWSAPVVWLIGKVGSGKSSIVEALTGSNKAEIGSGFKACTKTAATFDFPPDAPAIRFLDTRGIGEAHYNPDADIKFAEAQAHLLLVAMNALDPSQVAVFEVVRAARERHSDWPVIVAQTKLHEAYKPGERHMVPYPFDGDGMPTTELPGNLARSLAYQRSLCTKLPGRGAIRFVPLDFTRPEDGFEPMCYGLEALRKAIVNVAPAAVAAALDDGRVRVADSRARRAHPHIFGYAAAAAAADVVPMAGLVAVPGLQAKMLHSLGEIYGVDWDRRTMADFAGALGTGVVVRTLSGFGVRELAKLVPIWGQTAGATAAAAMSFTTTYALGKAAAYFLARRRQGAVADDSVLQAYKRALADAFEIRKQRNDGTSESSDSREVT